MNREELLIKFNMVSLENTTEKKSRDKFIIKDDMGYYYKLSFNDLGAAIKRDGVPRKFFGCNPFTFKNINTYFKNKSISVELLDREIKSATSKVEFKCLKHNVSFFKTWNDVSNGNGCSKCSKNRYLSYKDICEFFKEQGCEFLSESYNGIHKSYKMKCKCGKIIDKRADVFIHQKAYYCIECIGKKDNNIDSIRKELLENNIALSSQEYKNNNTKLDIVYSCGFKASRSIENIRKSKYTCPHCNKKGYMRNTESFKKEVVEITNGEYELHSEYKTMNDKVIMKHLACGETYEVTPHNFMDDGNRCPICRISRSEYRIKKYLDNKSISYKQQFEFNDLVSKRGGKLKFDFAIFNSDNELLCLIEYDGIFHYGKVHKFHDLKDQQERDKLKDFYCKKNNIKLYRIPYWEEDILENKIKNILEMEGLYE